VWYSYSIELRSFKNDGARPGLGKAPLLLHVLFMVEWEHNLGDDSFSELLTSAAKEALYEDNSKRPLMVSPIFKPCLVRRLFVDTKPSFVRASIPVSWKEVLPPQKHMEEKFNAEKPEFNLGESTKKPLVNFEAFKELIQNGVEHRTTQSDWLRFWSSTSLETFSQVSCDLWKHIVLLSGRFAADFVIDKIVPVLSKNIQVEKLRDLIEIVLPQSYWVFKDIQTFQSSLKDLDLRDGKVELIMAETYFKLYK